MNNIITLPVKNRNRSWEEVRNELKEKIESGQKVVARNQVEASALVEIILEDERYSHVRIHESVSRISTFYELEPVLKSNPITFPCNDLTDVFMKRIENMILNNKLGINIKSEN